jgi:hypothetical protein
VYKASQWAAAGVWGMPELGGRGDGVQTSVSAFAWSPGYQFESTHCRSRRLDDDGRVAPSGFRSSVIRSTRAWLEAIDRGSGLTRSRPLEVSPRPARPRSTAKRPQLRPFLNTHVARRCVPLTSRPDLLLHFHRGAGTL